MTYNAASNKIVCIANGGTLSVGDGSSKRIHHYVTNDTLATVAAADYFITEYTRLTVGDIIFVSADLDGTPATQQYMVLTSAVGGVTLQASA